MRSQFGKKNIIWTVVLSGQKDARRKVTNINIRCLLLAGGRSERIGKDKAFLPFRKNSTFIETIVRKIKFTKLEYHISIRSDQNEIYERIFPKNKLVFDHSMDIAGPLNGILSYFHYLKKNNLPTDYIFVLPTDMPYIRLATIMRLVRLVLENKNGLLGAFYLSKSGLEPLCGIYSTVLLSEWNEEFLIASKLEFSLQKRLKKILPKLALLPLSLEEENYFKNINHLSDMEIKRKNFP